MYPIVKRPDERTTAVAAYGNPKFVEDLMRDLSLSCRERGMFHRIEARNFESIHSCDATARLEWHSDDLCVLSPPEGRLALLHAKHRGVRVLTISVC